MMIRYVIWRTTVTPTSTTLEVNGRDAVGDRGERRLELRLHVDGEAGAV